MDEGLKVKYNVYKAKDGSIVNNCFVLRPDKDPAAIQALITYANVTPNATLGNDILIWVCGLEGDDCPDSMLSGEAD